MNFFEKVSVDELSDLTDESAVEDSDINHERIATEKSTLVSEYHKNTGQDRRVYQECSACGWCATPNKCVSSIECPECTAAVSELCQDVEAGNRLVAYHEARWQQVREMYGTYYK